tara:strand:- start:381 stop:644 length:264 start_codon:yes stop_codon:yes gene_type:complete
MGKKATKLAFAIRKENEALTKKYNPDNKLEDYQVKLKIPYEELLKQLSIQIEKDIYDYSSKNALPLCEYLDYANTQNYVKWLLSQQN